MRETTKCPDHEPQVNMGPGEENMNVESDGRIINLSSDGVALGNIVLTLPHKNLRLSQMTNMSEAVMFSVSASTCPRVKRVVLEATLNWLKKPSDMWYPQSWGYHI